LSLGIISKDRVSAVAAFVTAFVKASPVLEGSQTIARQEAGKGDLVEELATLVLAHKQPLSP
jgi:hypothetical protein